MFLFSWQLNFGVCRLYLELPTTVTDFLIELWTNRRSVRAPRSSTSAEFRDEYK